MAARSIPSTTPQYTPRIKSTDVFTTRIFPATPGGYARAPLLAEFSQSRAALREQKIRVLYLHAPDRSAESASFEDTLGAIDELFREGKM